MPIQVIFGLYWGYFGKMEKNMETTIMGYIGFRVWGLGFGGWCLGFTVSGLGFRVWGLGSGFMV